MSWAKSSLDAVHSADNAGQHELTGDWVETPQVSPVESVERGLLQSHVATEAAALLADVVGATGHVRVVMSGHANGPDGHKPIGWSGEFITITVSAIEENQL